MFDYVKYRNAWRYNLAPDRETELSKAQCKTLLKEGCWFVRNTYDFDQKEESDFWYIIKDSFGGMEEHSSNERRKIRKSLNYYDYKIINFKCVKDSCYPILKATFDDYIVKDRKMTKFIFNSYINYCNENSHDFWGIFNKQNNQLVGFCTIHNWGCSCEYGVNGIYPEFKHNSTYPFYGLFYKLNEYYLGEKKFKYVTDGSRSITEHSNIQPFLIQNFKFRKAYCKLKIHYKWWFGIIVKILFPFRKLIPNKSVKAVLKMHEIFLNNQNN